MLTDVRLPRLQQGYHAVQDIVAPCPVSRLDLEIECANDEQACPSVQVQHAATRTFEETRLSCTYLAKNACIWSAQAQKVPK